MKRVDLAKEKVGLAQVIRFAEKEPVLLVAENGYEFILSQADDFEAEVEALRNSYEFQAFLDQRMKSPIRIPIEDIEREVEAQLAGADLPNTTIS